MLPVVNKPCIVNENTINQTMSLLNKLLSKQMYRTPMQQPTRTKVQHVKQSIVKQYLQMQMREALNINYHHPLLTQSVHKHIKYNKPNGWDFCQQTLKISGTLPSRSKSSSRFVHLAIYFSSLWRH